MYRGTTVKIPLWRGSHLCFRKQADGLLGFAITTFNGLSCVCCFFAFQSRLCLSFSRTQPSIPCLVLAPNHAVVLKVHASAGPAPPCFLQILPLSTIFTVSCLGTTIPLLPFVSTTTATICELSSFPFYGYVGEF